VYVGVLEIEQQCNLYFIQGRVMMSVSLERDKGIIELGNTYWCYLLNLGELYGWRPAGSKKPKNLGFFGKWDGSYDGSNGQYVTADDALGFANALNIAVLDGDFDLKSNSLINEIQVSIENGIGEPLGYAILEDINIDSIKEIIEFLYVGGFTIN
jgi:hypothetical protein